MESKRLLECLQADYTRLREVAAGADLTAKVPTCPEWTVADLVDHVAMVYLHKVQCMRLGHHPQPWPPTDVDHSDPVALLDRAYTALAAEFAARSPDAPAFTWYEPDQTVGFWIRRMAQESVIHRVDAEFGAGVPIAAIPDDLARDGIDEVLVAFVEYGSRAWAEDYEPILATADGRAIRLETTGASWLVRPTPTAVEVRTADDGEAGDAVVRAEPVDLLLWLWNRAGDDVVATTGDPDVVAYFRRLMVAGTQ
jgi:uncharacterized protein (TIGR03083 family)